MNTPLADRFTEISIADERYTMGLSLAIALLVRIDGVDEGLNTPEEAINYLRDEARRRLEAHGA